ncbi:hypothetical protein LA080_005539 [Diaporthe eres]|nr:hypothetical protein LA080_005539 [Diaporthe eres]
MILIDTSTLQLHHVPELRDTPYAILSHTWGDDEVSYKDFGNLEQARSKSSYDKIVRTCQLAESRGLRYVWIDTCCIDKSSSAELTEAINSMFRWYRQAEVCFAYISDLPQRDGGPAVDWLNDGCCYRWFTRGWTLQELVAADKIEFYDAGWEYRGDKATLTGQLFRTTGIDEQVLADSRILPEIPVAKKISWAANRQTTRTEDMAYCLLGLFDINMPMIYGEGERAFIRLQEEIAKETNDLSLFAWTSKGEDDSKSFRGMFASSPAEFADCRNVRWADFLVPRSEFAVTNHGVRLETSLGLTDKKQVVLDLGCYGDTIRRERLGIYLHQTGTRFVRQRPDSLYYTQDPRLWVGKKSTVYIQKRLSPERMQRIRLGLPNRIYVRFSPYETGDWSIHITAAFPEALWISHGGYFLTIEPDTLKSATNPTYPRFTGVRSFDIRHRSTRHICSCLLICGIFEDLQGNYRPCAVVYTDADPRTKHVFEAITQNKGEFNDVLLRQIRYFLISKHSPDGSTLSWNDVSSREVQVGPLSIWVEIGMEGGLSISYGDSIDYRDPSGVERPALGDRVQNITSLPADYLGDGQYVVSVHVSSSRRRPRDAKSQYDSHWGASQWGVM